MCLAAGPLRRGSSPEVKSDQKGGHAMPYGMHVAAQAGHLRDAIHMIWVDFLLH